MINTFVENNKQMSDDEIIAQIHSGNYELLYIIIERYEPVVLYYVNKYCSPLYHEDAVQEANYALYSAVKGYDGSKSSFRTFATLCIKRSVIGVLKSQNCQKNIPDELLSPIEEMDIPHFDSPEKLFFEKEDFNDLKTNIKLELSQLEYKVLQLYLTGESYSDIATKLSITEKSVNNALIRIRTKLKR